MSAAAAASGAALPLRCLRWGARAGDGQRRRRAAYWPCSTSVRAASRWRWRCSTSITPCARSSIADAAFVSAHARAACLALVSERADIARAARRPGRRARGCGAARALPPRRARGAAPGRAGHPHRPSPRRSGRDRAHAPPCAAAARRACAAWPRAARRARCRWCGRCSPAPRAEHSATTCSARGLGSARGRWRGRRRGRFRRNHLRARVLPLLEAAGARLHRRAARPFGAAWGGVSTRAPRPPPPLWLRSRRPRARGVARPRACAARARLGARSAARARSGRWRTRASRRRAWRGRSPRSLAALRGPAPQRRVALARPRERAARPRAARPRARARAGGSGAPARGPGLAGCRGPALAGLARRAARRGRAAGLRLRISRPPARAQVARLIARCPRASARAWACSRTPRGWCGCPAWRSPERVRVSRATVAAIHAARSSPCRGWAMAGARQRGQAVPGPWHPGTPTPPPSDPRRGQGHAAAAPTWPRSCIRWRAAR